MRINCHAHVFNMASVLTNATVDVLLRRLRSEGFPDKLVDAVRGVLEKAVAHAGDYVAGDRLVHELLHAVAGDVSLSNAIAAMNETSRLQVNVLNAEILEDFVEHAAADLLGKILLAGDEESDARHGRTFGDLLDFARIGLQPSIDDVTAIVMEQLDGDDAIVPLAMDITDPRGADEKLYRGQLDHTAAQILAWPGRVLPFVGVNPKRGNTFLIAKEYLTNRGFVGVKLYPSLGWDVGCDAMKPVYEFCQANAVPLLMHCSRGGFYRAGEDIERSAPSLWAPLLEAYPGMKICFGHFGGDSGLRKGMLPTGWTHDIIELMKSHPGVFADIAYHNGPMAGGEEEANYFKAISTLLTLAPCKDRVLFGTDYWLARMQLREGSYWHYFEKSLKPGEMEALATRNASLFLGLPQGNGNGTWSIQRYVDFVFRNRHACRSAPAAWLVAALGNRYRPTDFKTVPSDRYWSLYVEAHVRVYSFFRDVDLTPTQKGLEFAKAGGLVMSQLPHWSGIFAGKTTQDEKCSYVAECLDAQMAADGAVPRQGFESAMKRCSEIKKAVSDHGTKIREVAERVREIYRFRSDGKAPEFK